MPEQLFRPWTPLDGVPKRLYLEAMHDDYEGLRFLLRGQDPQSRLLRLVFESPVAYRNINESYRLKTWAAILDMKALPSLLTVECSTWVPWLVEEAGGVLRPEKLVHFAIYTPEDCIDVATEFPPTVEWLSA